MSTPPKKFLTPEQYLEIERKAEFKSEYENGEMFPLGEPRPPHLVKGAHSLIKTNLSGQLYLQLRSGPCRVYSADQRVLDTCPDIVVVCGEPRFEDGELDSLVNPTVIVEVLSPTTEAYDRGRKFAHYRTIDSLKAYLMVASELMGAELYTKPADGPWQLTAEAAKLEDAFEIEPIGCRLKLADIYEKVDLG